MRQTTIEPPTDADPVRLVQGDCLDVLSALPDGCIDAVVTDPPYKLSQVYGSGVDADNLLAVSSLWPVSREWMRLTKPGGLAALFYDTRILPLALEAMRSAGWQYLRALTLYRRWGQASLVHGWMTTSDFVLLFAKPGAKPVFHGSARHDVYVKDRPEAESMGHPAQKPLEHVRHLVSHVCSPEGVVLDSYAGSGTTAEAARLEGRRAVLVEKDPAYCDIIRKRLAHASGTAPGSLFAGATA